MLQNGPVALDPGVGGIQITTKTTKKMASEGFGMDSKKNAPGKTHIPEEKSFLMNGDSTMEESGILGKRKPKFENLEEIRLQIERHEQMLAAQQNIILQQKQTIDQFMAIFGDMASSMMKMTTLFSQQANTVPSIGTSKFLPETRHERLLDQITSPNETKSKPDTLTPKRNHHARSQSEPSDTETDNTSKEVTDPASIPDQQRIGTPSKIQPEEPFQPVMESLDPKVDDSNTNSGKKHRQNSNSRSKGKNKSAAKADGDEEIMLNEEESESDQTNPVAVATTPTVAPIKVKGKPGRKPSAATLLLRAQKEREAAQAQAQVAKPETVQVPGTTRQTLITLSVDNGAVSLLNTNTPEAAAKPTTPTRTNPTAKIPTPRSKQDPSTSKEKFQIKQKDTNQNKENPEQKLTVKDNRDPKPPISKPELDFNEIGSARAGGKRAARHVAHIDPEEIEQEEKERTELGTKMKFQTTPTPNQMQTQNENQHRNMNKDKRRDLVNRSMTVSKETSDKKNKPREFLNERQKPVEIIKDRDLRKIHQLELQEKSLSSKKEEKPSNQRPKDVQASPNPHKMKSSQNSLHERSSSIKPRPTYEGITLANKPTHREPESLRALNVKDDSKPRTEVANSKRPATGAIIQSDMIDVPIKRKGTVSVQESSTVGHPSKANLIQQANSKPNLSTAPKQSEPASRKDIPAKPNPQPPTKALPASSKQNEPSKAQNEDVRPSQKSTIVPEAVNKPITLPGSHSPGRGSTLSPAHTPLGLVSGPNNLQDMGAQVKLEPGMNSAIHNDLQAEADNSLVQAKDICVFFPTEEFDLESSTPTPVPVAKIPVHVKIEDTGNSHPDDPIVTKTAHHLGMPQSSSSMDHKNSSKDMQLHVKREPDDPAYTATSLQVVSTSNNNQGKLDYLAQEKNKALERFKGTSSAKPKEVLTTTNKSQEVMVASSSGNPPPSETAKPVTLTATVPTVTVAGGGSKASHPTTPGEPVVTGKTATTTKDGNTSNTAPASQHNSGSKKKDDTGTHKVSKAEKMVVSVGSSRNPLSALFAKK